MAKKFMCVCLGILALMVAFHIGAQYGQAGYVDHTATGIIAQQSNIVLLDNGEAWIHYDDEQGWSLTECQLPVPLSDVKFWQGHTLVTNGDEFWDCSQGIWQNHGSPPGAAMTQSATWSRIKAEFGE